MDIPSHSTGIIVSSQVDGQGTRCGDMLALVAAPHPVGCLAPPSPHRLTRACRGGSVGRPLLVLQGHVGSRARPQSWELPVAQCGAPDTEMQV